MPACAELHETIWHQGTVFPASAVAIPFLLELLTTPGAHHLLHPYPGSSPGYQVSASGCAASLMCAIVMGEGHVHFMLRADGKELLQKRLANIGLSLEQALKRDREMIDSIRRQVSAGLQGLLPYLSAPAPDLRSLVAETLGRFPEHKSWLVPAIDGILTLESDEDVRKLLVESKARLTENGR